MKNNLQAPILITGCARSGTSLVAGIINICGAFGGEMSGPNHNNRRGMFENARIRNTIVKPHLTDIGVDPMGQFPLPDPSKLALPAGWSNAVERVMVEQGYKEGSWMYKGAKMCLTWPIWSHAFPDAKWIIVRRRTGDITTSCIKTGFMRAFTREPNQRTVGADCERDGWTWWVNEHLARFREMQDEGLNIKVVWPERMVDGDYTQIKETIEWLGLEWTTEVMNFIDPLLWRNKNKRR